MTAIQNFHGVAALLVLIIPLSSSLSNRSVLPGCTDRCGDVDIPYPFGLSENCSINSKFVLKCNDSKTPIFGKNLQVTQISAVSHEMTIMWYVGRDCYEASGKQPIRRNTPTLKIPTVSISPSRNKLVALGCDSYAVLQGYENNTDYSFGCMSNCYDIEDVDRDGTCAGIGCCQVDIPRGMKNLKLFPSSFSNHTSVSDFNLCTYAFVVEASKFNFSRRYLSNFNETMLPLVVDWAVNDGHGQCGSNNTVKEVATVEPRQFTCRCKDGYSGNPYLPLGCITDIDECVLGTNNCTHDQKCVNSPGSFQCIDTERTSSQLPIVKIAIGSFAGFVALVISGYCLYLAFKRRKALNLRHKFFEQNGGLMLQQNLLNSSSNVTTPKIFSHQDLRKATQDYHDSRVIGRGGFGTVYKGILPDGTVVAIKKSKLVDQDQTQQFVNEVMILSQINHRNVVSLLGCCLETQVPSLVYEFVPNSTLSDHIHDKERSRKLSWQIRLRIAAETAEALSYLHSSASVPIVHRDVKPSNILLDHDYTAKVSDFGASKFVPVDRTELATMVQGTLGYLDPEYLQTNQLTDKSDVYSFGVILAELLTGKTALSSGGPEERKSLAVVFVSCLKENRVLELVEREVLEEWEREQMVEVAQLAKRCLSLAGEGRPSMREVATELEGVRRMLKKHPWSAVEEQSREWSKAALGETQQHLLKDMTTSLTSANEYDSIPPHHHVIVDVNGR